MEEAVPCECGSRCRTSSIVERSFLPQKSTAEREEELAQLGLRAKQRYAEARNQRDQRRLVITEKNVGKIPRSPRPLPGPSAQSKGSKLLSKARTATPAKTRAPKMRRVGRDGAKPSAPSFPQASFLEKWSGAEVKQQQQARSNGARVGLLGSPPRELSDSKTIASTSAVPIQPLNSASAGASPLAAASSKLRSPLHVPTVRPVPSETATPYVDFFGSSSSSSSLKRKRKAANPLTVSVTTVTKKRTGVTASGSGSPAAATSPGSNPTSDDAGSDTVGSSARRNQMPLNASSSKALDEPRHVKKTRVVEAIDTTLPGSPSASSLRTLASISQPSASSALSSALYPPSTSIPQSSASRSSTQPSSNAAASTASTSAANPSPANNRTSQQQHPKEAPQRPSGASSSRPSIFMPSSRATSQVSEEHRAMHVRN